MSVADSDLRALVAEVIREAIAGAGPDAPPWASPDGVGPARVESIQIRDDRDLDRFVRNLIALFENPKSRRDLRYGRLRFRLDRASTQPSGSLSALRIERGAVTERQVAEASDGGRRIVLGRRAVLTPLGRERAKALGVPIEKER